MRNKILTGLFTVIISTIAMPSVAQAGLWSYYNEELGEVMPSREVRAAYAEDIGIEDYSGTATQNIALEKYLREIHSWESKVVAGTVTDEELEQVPERVWKRLVPQVIQTISPAVIPEEGMLGFGDPIISKEITCLDTECDALLTQEEQSLGFTVASRYRTTLQSSMTSVQTTVPVSSIATFDGHTLTMADLGSSVYLTVEPGASREEIVKCTTITSSQWSGCTRGLAFYGTSTLAVANNQKAHNAGAIVVMSNVHYVYDELTDKDTAETITGVKTYTAFPVFSPATTLPTTNGQFATKYYVDTVGAGGFTSVNVSTTRGLSVDGSSPEKVGINASTTTGIKFSTADGSLYQAVSSTKGISSDTNGIYIDTTDELTWANNQTFASTTVASSTITQLNLNGRNANTLVGGTNADSLHLHQYSYLLYASTTARTVSDTTAATIVFSTSTPANILSTGNILRVRFYVDDFRLLETAASDNMNLTVTYGGTTVTNINVVNNTGVDGNGQSGILEFNLIGAGATNSQIANFYGVLNESGTLNFGNNSAAGNYSESSLFAVGTAAVDSTVAQTLTVTVTFEGASVNNAITFRHAILEVLQLR